MNDVANIFIEMFLNFATWTNIIGRLFLQYLDIIYHAIINIHFM